MTNPSIGVSLFAVFAAASMAACPAPSSVTSPADAGTGGAQGGPGTGGNPGGAGGTAGNVGTVGTLGTGGSFGTGGSGQSGGNSGSGGSGASAGSAGNTGGNSSGGQTGAAGSGSTGGGSGNGGSRDGGVTDGNPDGAGGRGGSGGQGGAAAPFVCSQIIGLTLTSEWYLAGFENGVDPARWQLKYAQSAYVNEWANTNSSFWGTAVTSPCARNSTSPDRVVLVVLSWTIMAQNDWETAVTGAVNTIKAKYEGVTRIDLMTIVRGPQNRSCGDPAVYAENTHIPVTLDDALAKVAAASPDMVRLAPKFEVSACSDFTGVGPHLTAAGNTKMATMIAASYAQDP